MVIPVAFNWSWQARFPCGRQHSRVVAFDLVLGLILRSVSGVSFVIEITDIKLAELAVHMAGFGIALCMVAYFELGHLVRLI